MSAAAAPIVIRGHTVAFAHDPFVGGTGTALDDDVDGALLLDNGLIRDMGPAREVMARHAGVAVAHFPGHFILPGFVDAHAHFAQTGIIGSYGRQLIDWLEKYTFPAELAFADVAHARRIAGLYLDECLRNGITTASVYCTVHAHSADVLFEVAAARGMRIAAGKVMMDRNAPAGLTDTARASYDESRQLIDRWHGRGRASYVISPRFALTSTPAQLEAAGALWREHPTTLVQTHMDENPVEIARVRELFPHDADYLAVYERFGLVGPGANLGHAIHLTERERFRIVETGAGLSHCPTSNMFLGSGLFHLHGLAEADVPIGLGSDVGAGTSFSMFAVMRGAYDVAQLRGRSLHPAEALWLATQGSARVLRLDDRIGNLKVGYEADVVVVDPWSRPLVRERMAGARDVADALFAQMILADDRAIRAVYVAGRLAYENYDGEAIGARGIKC